MFKLSSWLRRAFLPAVPAPAQREEERLIFYVAVTREQLFLNWPRKITTADRRTVTAPLSVFLQGKSDLLRTETVPF